MPSRKRLTVLFLASGIVPALQGHAQRPSAPPTIQLRAGLVITQSARVAPGLYRVAVPASLDSGVITIRGNNITVDFAGATLEGIAPDSAPDLARGVAIRVEGG